MIGLNAGLEIARKALSAYQLAISVHGNNIANVNTPGFSRRRLILGESEPVVLPMGRIGLGVDAEAIRRMRDTILDSTFRKENGSYGKNESMDRTLAQVEMVFTELSELGLGSVLEDFWVSWQELANQPESVTARTLVVGRASALCESLHRLDARLNSMRENLDLEIRGCVERVNSLADAIAVLNGAIVESEASGNEASDLRDQRDLLIDELSTIVEVQVFESADGSASVKIGCDTLVERMDTVRLRISTRGDNGIVVSDVTIAGSGRKIPVSQGELAGLLECRDRAIPDYLSKLDSLAATIVERVNEVHRSGYGLDGLAGRDFFDPTKITAATIAVSQSVVEDVNLIAASADASVGNGDIALAISDLRLARLFGDGATADEYYSSIIGELGIEASHAADETEAQQLLVQEIQTRRESVKGVSLDEEMTSLVAAQHAYEAAVKLVSVIDSLMTTIMTAV